MSETPVKSKPLVLMLSGHCNTAHLNRVPDEAHARCMMAVCPCACHFQHLDQYECGCGGTLVETALDNPDPADRDEDGNPEPVYLHVRTGNDGTVITVLGQECP